MCRRTVCLAVFAAVVSLYVARAARADVTVEKGDDKVVVKIDGQLLTEYLTCSGPSRSFGRSSAPRASP